MQLKMWLLFGLTGTITASVAQGSEPRQQQMDLDLMEITIPQLEAFYAAGRYTVTQVVQWHLDRIARYNGVYRSIQTVDAKGALAIAALEDAEAAKPDRARGPMWGVPIVIKANTSIAGRITTDGWIGYTLPGHELVAPRDATVVVKLKAAGAVILGQTNMPDFAASDTNRSTAFGRTGNAYDVRFSPGGSSGGTVTTVTSNEALLGTGTDTGNSIRMPAATSSVVGLFPTRGLVSIAGIAPLDWLLDNTGPIVRDVTDAAIGLTVMAGEDPMDPRTAGSGAKAQPGPYTQYLYADALRGKRFGVPSFILAGAGIPFQGIEASISPTLASQQRAAARVPLTLATRAAFLRALDGLRAAGATVVMDNTVLPDTPGGFPEVVSRVGTQPYVREGTENFLKSFGPAQYHSPEEYQQAVGSALPATILGGSGLADRTGAPAVVQTRFESDPQREANVLAPRARALALYTATLDRLHLDGYVYPATQMPPPDETMPQDGQISGGPHSDTGWVNMLGVPAIVVPGGFYPGGLPFGLEFSARPWRDGDLLSWAYAYEQQTHARRAPVLVERGLLADAP